MSDVNERIGVVVLITHIIATILLLANMIKEYLIGPDVWVAEYVTEEVFKIVPYTYYFFTLGMGSDGCLVYEYFNGLTLLGGFTIILLLFLFPHISIKMLQKMK